MKPLQFIEARSAANRLRSSQRKAAESSRRSAAATDVSDDWVRPGESTKDRDARLAQARKADRREHQRALRQHYNIGVNTVRVHTANVNAGVDYSKLNLLGKVLVEKRWRKDAPGQTSFVDSGSEDAPRASSRRRKKRRRSGLRGSRRAARPTPKRRRGEGGRRAQGVDQPGAKRPPGFDPRTHGERQGDLIATKVAKQVSGDRPKIARHDPAKLAVVAALNQLVKQSVKKAVTPYKPTVKVRKQNPHTATSPIDT